MIHGCLDGREATTIAAGIDAKGRRPGCVTLSSQKNSAYGDQSGSNRADLQCDERKHHRFSLWLSRRWKGECERVGRADIPRTACAETEAANAPANSMKC